MSDKSATKPAANRPGTFKKGEKKPNQGKRGPNKVTKELKAMILQALDNAGGVTYLTMQAEENPKAFMSLLGRVLPMQVTGEGGGPVHLVLSGSDIHG